MFTRLGTSITRRPWLYVIAWLLAIAIAGTATVTGFGGKGLFERLVNSTSMVPGSESDRVSELTSSEDAGPTTFVIVSGLDLTTDAAPLARQLPGIRSRFTSDPAVESVVDPFVTAGAPTPATQSLMSAKGDGFAMLVTLKKGLPETTLDRAHAHVAAAIDQTRADLLASFPDARVEATSTKLVVDAINSQVETDLLRGESIGLPVALLLMVIVFGGLIAAGLPMMGAIASIVVSMGVLLGMTYLFNVDSFILNVISIIGLALSIDYGLLVVSRFREEISRAPAASGRSQVRAMVVAAVRRTVATAGRTVTFSALTIAFAISGLLVLKAPILRNIGIGGILVVLLAVSSALTLVPALLTLFGGGFVRPSPLARVPGLKQVFAIVGDAASDQGRFSTLAHWVHKRPWPVMLVVIAILGVMAAPVGGLNMRSDFAQYTPRDSTAARAYTRMQADYPALANPTIVLVADATPAQTGALVARLQAMDHVTSVSPPAALNPTQTRINVHLDVPDQVGPQATDAMTQIRDIDPGYPVLVGGGAALQYDFVRSLLAGAPLAGLIVVLAVLVLLFLMTGSVIVPIKALVINLFSLAASLGATVLIFEHGLFGLPKVAGLETFIVACTIAFGFGLAMDYEVFLLARIKEYWDAGHTNNEAVEMGLQRSGRIITSAAAIIIAVFIGFVFGDMLAIKQIGVALAITVATDATLVRLLLVPATMTVLGRWNWWAPRPMQRLYRRFRIVH